MHLKKVNFQRKLLRGLGGGWAVAQGSGDSALQLHTLIAEELGDDYTAEQLESLLGDEEAFMKMRRSAAIKGGTTALVDFAFKKLLVWVLETRN